MLDPRARAESLAVGAQQRLEIVKALSRDARVLILDEPTAVLAPPEADELLRWLRAFATGGNSVVLITHKLREALAIADDVTVLRRGRVMHAGPARALSANALAALLLGEPVAATQPDARDRSPARDIGGRGQPMNRAAAAEVVASVATLRLPMNTVSSRCTARRSTSEAGEIVGVAAVEGSGQRELLRALAGRSARCPRRGAPAVERCVRAGGSPPRRAGRSTFRLRRTSRCTGAEARRGRIALGGRAAAHAASCSRASTCAAMAQTCRAHAVRRQSAKARARARARRRAAPARCRESDPRTGYSRERRACTSDFGSPPPRAPRWSYIRATSTRCWRWRRESRDARRSLASVPRDRDVQSGAPCSASHDAVASCGAARSASGALAHAGVARGRRAAWHVAVVRGQRCRRATRAAMVAHAASEAAWLTTIVQLGFVFGTAGAALLNLADVLPSRRYFAVARARWRQRRTLLSLASDSFATALAVAVSHGLLSRRRVSAGDEDGVDLVSRATRAWRSEP